MCRPSRPTTSSAPRNFVVANPVARMIVSTRRAVTVGAHDRIGRDLGDGLDHQLDVGPVERRVVEVRRQWALAPERHGRRELALQLGVFDDSDVEPACGLGRGSPLRIREREVGVDGPEDLGATFRDRRGIALELAELLRGERRVLLGEHPVRRTLVHVELPDVGRDLGNELHRAGRAADHRHRLAGEVVVLVPAGRVEDGAAERVETGDVGGHWGAEHAERAHDDLGFDLLTRVDGQAPDGAVVVPARGLHLGAQPQVGFESESLHALLEVDLDLGLAGVRACPRRVRRERERIEMGLDVALRAGVAVVPPGAADARCLLQDHEVVVTRLEQPHPRADPARAGADDRDTTRPIGS